MPKPRITVITPCLNQAPYIERTICSVLDQEYDNLEHFIIDGGSTDGTAQIIQLYSDELAWWNSDSDTGPADAINKGLIKATGDVVAILHADDLYLPDTLNKISRLMSGPNAPDWAVGSAIRIGESDQKLGKLEPVAPESFSSMLMHNSGYFPIAASFFRRNLMDVYGLLDDSFRYAYDYEFFCRLVAAGERPTIINQTLAACRENDCHLESSKIVREGVEFIAASRRHADQLPLSERYALWVNCDLRERIYTLAQAELQGNHSRRFLWHQLLRRPWWLAHDRIRHALVHSNHRSLVAGARSAA